MFEINKFSKERYAKQKELLPSTSNLGRSRSGIKTQEFLDIRFYSINQHGAKRDMFTFRCMAQAKRDVLQKL